MRRLATLVVGALLFGAFVVLRARRLPPPVQPSIQAPPAKAAAAKVSECKDACEQRAIVEQIDDGALRACRARCDSLPASGASPASGPSPTTGAPNSPWIERTYHSKRRAAAETQDGLPPLRRSKTLPAAPF